MASNFAPLTANFDWKSEYFIIWILMDSMYISFGLYFLCLYCRHRKTYIPDHKHLKVDDIKILNKLRLSMVFLCILGLPWPLNYYLTQPPPYFTVIAYTFATAFDLLLMVILLIVGRRIIREYYDLMHIRKIPFGYLFLLGLYCCASILAEILYTLPLMPLKSDKWQHRIQHLWVLYLYLFGIVFLFLFYFLMIVSCRLSGYMRGLNIQKEITPLNRNESRDKQLFQRIIQISMGLMLYSLNIVCIVIYLLISGLIEGHTNYKATKSLWWEVQFNLIGQVIALISLFCFLRSWPAKYPFRDSTVQRMNSNEPNPMGLYSYLRRDDADSELSVTVSETY